MLHSRGRLVPDFERVTSSASVTASSRILPYLYALLAVGATLGVRLLLVPWLGAGAAFNFFFVTVLIANILWGAGPGLLSGALSAAVAGVLFTAVAGYSVPNAALHGVLFLGEAGAVSLLVDRLKRARLSEHQALVRVEGSNEKLKHMAAELVESQKLLQSVVDYSPNVIFIKDMRGAFVMVNKKAAQLLGMSESDLKGKTNFDVFPHHVAEALQAKDDAVFKAGVGLTYEETIEVKGGPHVFLSTQFPYYDDEGRLLGLCGILSDISERKRTEQALQTREAELKEAQRVAHMGSWTRDREGNVVLWSEELYRIFGWDREKPPPSFSELPSVYTPESMAKLAPAIDRLLNEGVPYELELEFRRPDGSMRWISSRAEPVRDPSGRITGLRGTAQDVTELKELQRLRQEWTSVVAHDLRQPLGVIHMAAGLLSKQRAGAMTDQEKRNVDRIRLAALNLSRMVDDLLDVSQVESRRLELRRSWVDLRDIAQEIIERLAFLTSGFEVKLSESGDPSPVLADAARVEQILGNLISNAAKYGEPGTEIGVHVEHGADQVRVSVTNRGRGILPEEVPPLFDRFFRSKASRTSGIPGLGLGLYITKGLVEAHGGRIWVESEPGKTTTLYFTLPTGGAPEAPAG